MKGSTLNTGRTHFKEGYTPWNKKIHWANISRLYKRDLDDWMRLCAKCHKAYDMDKLMLTEIRG